MSSACRMCSTTMPAVKPGSEVSPAATSATEAMVFPEPVGALATRIFGVLV